MVIENLNYLDLSMSDFGKRLKENRLKKKITQTRLAELLEVSPRVYNRWEKGSTTPHFETVVKIADILQVHLDELAGRKLPSQEPIIRNPKLHALYHEVDRLTDEDQKALIILLDSLVKRAQFSKILAS